MRAALYCRVSTEDQNLDNQLVTLQTWALALDLEVVMVYAEKESAWQAGHQVELKRLLQDADRRQFDVVLVWALDRLTREGALRILGIVDRLKTAGVRLYSHQETWTMAPAGIEDVLYSITAWVAQFESKRRSERTKYGIERRRREGKPIGRPTGSKDSRQRIRRGRGQIRAGVGIQRGLS